MALTNEELKRNLAKVLWENGFGDEPYRNWRMAELMIIDDGFLSWRRQALALAQCETRGETDAPDYEQALNDFHTGGAYWLYATSLGMSWPSHDSDTNWLIAGAVRRWLCTVGF